MNDLKPILAGIFGTALQFTHVELGLKIIVGVVTFAYVSAKLFVLVSNHREKLLHPFRVLAEMFRDVKR